MAKEECSRPFSVMNARIATITALKSDSRQSPSRSLSN
jgi:hypothetical protein